jgi:hypothetical protein
MSATAIFLRAATLAGASLLPGLAQAALPPAGSLYKLTVKTSFEPNFVDCWTFSTNGRFIHSPMLNNFPYQLTGLNTNAGHFQAIWQGRVSIAFSGITNGSTISGDAVDVNDRTYSFTGTQVSSCAGIPIQKAGHGGFLTH